MVDFLKFDYYLTDTKLLLKNPLLSFTREVEEETGELLGKATAIYKGCKFIVWDSGRFEFQGSLHKMNNDGLHNYDDFTWEDCKEAIQSFNKVFDLCLGRCTIRNIEFGVNFKPPIATKEVLRHIYTYKSKEFKSVSLRQGDFKEVQLQRYNIKIYDKGFQYFGNRNPKEDILRFELKFRKMIDLNREGLVSLDDLCTGEWFGFIEGRIKKVWKDIILFDPTIEMQRLNFKQRDQAIQWSNPIFWIELDRTTRFNEIEKYNRLVKVFSAQLKLRVVKSILIKFNSLKETKQINHVAKRNNRISVTSNSSSIRLGFFRKFLVGLFDPLISKANRN